MFTVARGLPTPRNRESLTFSHTEQLASPLRELLSGNVLWEFLKLCHLRLLPPSSGQDVLKKKKKCTPGFKRVAGVRIGCAMVLRQIEMIWGFPVFPTAPLLAGCLPRPPHPLPQCGALSAVPCAPHRAPPRLLPAGTCHRGQAASPLRLSLLLERRPLIRAQPAPVSTSGAEDLGCRAGIG